MNQEADKLFTLEDLYPIHCAQKEILKSYSANSRSEQLRRLGEAAKEIDDFVSLKRNHDPVPLTDEEVNLSYALHTWLRKGEDSILSGVLHSSISSGRHSKLWSVFVRCLFKLKKGSAALEAVLREIKSSSYCYDSYLFYSLLEAWGSQSIDFAYDYIMKT